MHQLPITEKDISTQLQRTIKSPILVAGLKDVNVDQDAFVSFFSPLFAQLDWDPYDVRRLQVEFLLAAFPHDATRLRQRFKAYYTGQQDLSVFDHWINQLDDQQAKDFAVIQPWRRRSIAQFFLKPIGASIQVTREPVQPFAQAVEDGDVRSWPRVFSESPAAHVEHDLFYDFMRAVFRQVKKVHPLAYSMRMTAHFMSVKATRATPGNNSPEGAHEDGANFIVSALVINRKNLKGGATQIIEKRLPDGPKEKIFEYILQPGEFCFQGDSRDEEYYGTDLWHHVTPFYLADESAGEGWRDIIGFDIDVVDLA